MQLRVQIIRKKMKMRSYKKMLLTVIAMGSWIVISSQQYPDSLITYLEAAAKNNPAVQQKFTEYQAALQKVPQVGSLSDPELSLGLFLKPMELVNGKQVADIRLMQMLPWFGVLRYAKDEMSMMANAKFEFFRDAKLQVYYDVQRTWYELFKIRKNITITDKNIEILQVIERLALVKYKSAPPGEAGAASAGSGMLPGSSQEKSSGASSGMQSMGGVSQNTAGSAVSGQSADLMQPGSMSSSSGGSGLADLYRIMIEAGDLENNLASLKNQEQTLTALFNSYLNRPPLTPVFTDSILTADSPESSLVALSDTVLAGNPMLTMLEYEGEAYGARKNMVTRMGYPMVGLGLNYSLIRQNEMTASPMNGTDMLMPMVSVTLPIYRKKYNAMKSEADLLRRAASQNYQATSNTLQADYYKALQVYDDAKRRMTLYEKQYQLASKSLDLVMKSFSASKSDLTDVLRVQQQTLDYELKQVEAVADLNTAVAWLKRLMAYSQTE
ncbi:MAG: TolC family protein [Bacteroidia bacterium]|nr:MAG: TolC family protein [Bacteroidia bacterium]